MTNPDNPTASNQKYKKVKAFPQLSSTLSARSRTKKVTSTIEENKENTEEA